MKFVKNSRQSIIIVLRNYSTQSKYSDRCTVYSVRELCILGCVWPRQYTRSAMTRYARVYQSYPYRATVASWVEVARCSTCAWLRARVHKTLCVHWIRPRAAFTRRRRDTSQSIPICFRFRHPLRAPPSYVPGISMIFAWKQIYLASFPPHPDPTVDFQFLPWIPWGRSAPLLTSSLHSPSSSLCVSISGWMFRPILFSTCLKDPCISGCTFGYRL